MPNVPEFIVDFIALTLADRLLLSISSFSQVAAMISSAKSFSAPNLLENRLTDFDPWSSYDTEMLIDARTRHRNGDLKY